MPEYTHSPLRQQMRGKFSQLDLFSFFEEFKVSTFLEARFTGFLTYIDMSMYALNMAQARALRRALGGSWVPV